MTRRLLRIADPEVAPYPLLTSLVVPRPIAWVSTRSADGVGNLAPHSFFTVVCADPPMVAFASIGRKDTLSYIEATGEFVVNLATESLLAQVNDSSAPFGQETDEAAVLGIATEPSTTVTPPRVADSPAALECTLETVLDLGTSWLVVGRVQLIAVDEAAFEGDHPAMAALRPLSRLGRDEWGLPPDVVSIARPRSPEETHRSE